nr:reverse transcriptase domain-containing protein [Tanacetum cinerariifolium]
MMSIFHDMIEKAMEVFLDDFSVFGDSFSSCLTNLDKMLNRCEETNLVLNWEKCYFMCREGIVLGHKISKSGIEVNRAKVDLIAKLPHPTTVKGLPSDVYSLVNHHRVAKDLWERIQLLMQGRSLTKQKRECKLYDAFDKFAHIKEESLYHNYLRFTQLINDMNIYKMILEQFQVNTKFLNNLPPYWSKFVTDVKLVKDLHTTNFDHLNAYLEQHELHANEVRIMRVHSHDPLALVANHQMAPSHFNTYQSSYNNPQFQQQFSPSHQGECHMERQCPKPKRKRDATWFRDKVLLVEAQGSGKVLNEEELAFLADPKVAEGPITQTVITHNAAYQVDDLDAYDYDCDDFSTAKAVLMANFSSYRSNVLSEVPHSENTHNDILNQSVQEMPYSEQTHIVNYVENAITSDSNIIPYSQYLLETQNAAVHDTNSFAQQDAMILSVFEQLSNQVTNYNKVNKDNLIANESLSAKLERYKERVKLLEERQNVDLSTRDKLIMDDIIRVKNA